MRPFELNRRTFLRGAGVALALPWLEALAPRRALAGARVPQRFVGFYVPNGIHMARFTPAKAGANYRPTPLLAPLFDAGLGDRFSVLSGLENFAATPQGDGPGDHARGTGSFLTAAHVRKSEAELENGISLDQVIAGAQRGEGAPPFPSLELGCEGGSGSGNCDSGYGCAYTRSIAWAGAATPMPKMTQPRAVFDRLFGPPGAELDRERAALRRAHRKSVLDVVRDDTTRLAARLGARDRHKVEEYLAGVREVERRIEASPDSCTPGPRPDDAQEDFEAYVRVMLDLLALAFRCDQTRVATFMLGNGVSGRSYRFLGIEGGHHEISHHQGDPAKLAALEKIGTWEVAQFAHLLTLLAAIPEGEGTVLDHSTLFFSSDIEDGNSHAHANLPVLLAGRGGGAFVPGRHVVFPEHTPMANLFLTILRSFGLPHDRFGDDGTAPLDGLS